jgi:hypothetical protein
MSQQELLTRVVAALEEAGTPYMLTGSLVSSLQGEPRSTHDFDFVVLLEPEAAPRLAESLARTGGYVDADRVRESAAARDMFNLIDTETGLKVDFWVLTDDLFDRSRFTRRRHESVLGLEIPVSSPEDTILGKLRWGQLAGGSEKQFMDALRVYEVQHPHLDRKYLEEWAVRLGVEEGWSRILAAAEPLEG